MNNSLKDNTNNANRECILHGCCGLESTDKSKHVATFGLDILSEQNKKKHNN